MSPSACKSPICRCSPPSSSAYAFSTAGSHLFFGGEIAEAASLERYRAEHPRVDLALLPVNGLRPLFGPRLVMGPAHAVAGASVLGATTLIPVHDAHGRDPLSALFRPTGTAADAVALAGPGLRVVDLPTGERWEPAR
ncbi:MULTISPECIES: hypothetical protein [Streptomyces]|uniref:Metallo-beta-lactamase domain-containing protein n=1 Tax=Streptomyces lonegramiae TaxID=3075524 RepID=A0ABU2X5X3_9ACTN|nr:hypothetical protein [Streptomyces sp. DSM 41529]MDT0541306.1 hypothetical protein [Streptomyces sp. DSM 41529]